MSQPDSPIKVFISYSHRDDNLRSELLEHLSNLRRQGYISEWHDRLLVPGERWAGEIDENLNSAQIVLLLISASFMASDYCYDIEMVRAIERHKAGKAIVIPVILRDCDWQQAPFSKFQVVPQNAKPITSWPNRDEAFVDVARGIRKAVERFRAKPELSSTNKPFSRSKPRPLLPYFCDRSEQEAKLGAELRRHQKEKNARAIVCLMHGDEYESHGEFLERLRCKSLPKVLNLEMKQLSIKEYTIQRLPRRVSHGAFWASIGEALLQDSSASQEEIWQHISHHEEPMMLSLHLLAEDFEGSGEGQLKSLIDFYNSWEDLPPGRSVINCICLKYRRLGKVGWLDFKKKRLQQLHEKLRELVERMDFSAYPNVTVIVLPELQAITRSDVVSWSRDESVREFCSLSEKEIRTLFEHKELCDEAGRIPMELLAERLRQFVEG